MWKQTTCPPTDEQIHKINNQPLKKKRTRTCIGNLQKKKYNDQLIKRFYFTHLFMRNTQREAETQAEGEVGSLRAA